MKNVYDSVITLDNKGEADIDLPSWFGALNKDYRYQLTLLLLLDLIFTLRRKYLNLVYTTLIPLTITTITVVVSGLQAVLQV